MQLYAYLLTPVGGTSKCNEAGAAEAEIMAAHFRHLQQLHVAKVLKLAGVGGHAHFGLVLFEADSPLMAESTMNDDPLVSSGCMRAECVPFQVVLEAGLTHLRVA